MTKLDADSVSLRWPVIVGIVVGSLIILSIVFCIARCVCFGAECACCCFRCCTGCCGGGSRRDGYQQQPPPAYPPTYPPGGGYNQPYRSPQPLAYSSPQPQYNARGAQFASFDVSKPINEDSLPAMPTWEDATSKKIETIEEPEGHEMDKLNPDGLAPSGAPKLPSFDTTPTDERESFVGGQQNVSHGDSSSGYRGSAPAPVQTGAGFGSQAYGGYGGGYAPANQRSPQASPPPQAALGYGSRPGYDRSQSYNSQQRSPRSPPVQGYGQSGLPSPYGAPRNQPSPVYAPGGSAAYDPPINNQQYNAYEQPGNNGSYHAYNPGQSLGGYNNQGYGDQGYGAPRRPAQGSWRDV